MSLNLLDMKSKSKCKQGFFMHPIVLTRLTTCISAQYNKTEMIILWEHHILECFGNKKVLELQLKYLSLQRERNDTQYIDIKSRHGDGVDKRWCGHLPLLL